ncbi:unnamed protein product [Clonostachys rosea f. rosea IK726]|uniref:Zn(2)-C6 fungal-type domain-containing protein n=2 Tax=Bionectria ochroleuca TaxID=29856 RepID=A0A0B7KJJ8_BIOOC|nr:unnamed protein product [Clonostachys rosea f. rosea IK726]
MVGRHGTLHASGARGPKYRTSCDRCQAAKVKCGHEKPSCRRCAYHKVDCVYGISRRMGRPRARKSPAKDSSPSPQASTNSASDENSRSKPATPAVTLGEAEPVVEIQQSSPAINAEGGNLSTESAQISEPWAASLTTLFEPPELNQVAVEGVHNDPMLESLRTPLAFLPTPTENRMDLDDYNGYPTMSAFLDDISDSMISQQPIPAPSALEILDPQALLPTEMPVGHPQESFGQVNTIPTPVQTTQPENGSNTIRQTDSHHQSSPSSVSKRRVSMGQSMSDMFLSLTGHEGNIHAAKPSSGTHIASGPRTSAAARGESTATHVEPHYDVRPMSKSGKVVIHEKDDGCCNCHIVVTDCIVSLKAEQQRSGLVPIDCALRMETEVETSLSAVHECQSCRCESSIHLLSLVGVRLMLDILQKTVRDEFVMRPRRINSGTISINNSDILWIGSFKVSPKTRCRFLKKLVQARFCRLAMLVERGGKVVTSGPAQDCYSQSGDLLLEDISKGLRTTMGWVTLWNSKH